MLFEYKLERNGKIYLVREVDVSKYRLFFRVGRELFEGVPGANGGMTFEERSELQVWDNLPHATVYKPDSERDGYPLFLLTYEGKTFACPTGQKILRLDWSSSLREWAIQMLGGGAPSRPVFMVEWHRQDGGTYVGKLIKPLLPEDLLNELPEVEEFNVKRVRL